MSELWGLIALGFLLAYAYAVGIPIAVPAATVAIALLRRVVRLPPLLAAIVVAALVGVAVVGVFATVRDAQRPKADPFGAVDQGPIQPTMNMPIAAADEREQPTAAP